MYNHFNKYHCAKVNSHHTLISYSKYCAYYNKTVYIDSSFMTKKERHNLSVLWKHVYLIFTIHEFSTFFRTVLSFSPHISLLLNIASIPPHRILRQLHIPVRFYRILYMGRPLGKHQPENGLCSFFPFPLRFRHGQAVNILGQMTESCTGSVAEIPGAFSFPIVLIPIHPAFEPGQVHPPFSENRL